MKGEAALAPVLPGVAQCGHFAKVRGINAWEECKTAVIVGREQVSPQRLEDMARPFTVADPEPFQAFGRYVRQTRGRRMRSGEVRPVEVEIHPDPRCQELLEQIREAEIVQAADRVRPIFNERAIVLLNDLALDVTYDRIMTHKELAMDGNRFEQAAARGAAVPLSATEMHRCFDNLWMSVKAAEHDRERTPKSQIELLFGKWGFFPARYRRAGQRCPSRAMIRADAPDPRAALESVVGSVVWFEIEQAPETVEKGDVSQIDATPPDPADRVVPFRPPAPQPPLTTADELERCRRVLAAADGLADLSTRLEQFARPPPASGIRELAAAAGRSW
jgi:hypothetical protein